MARIHGKAGVLKFGGTSLSGLQEVSGFGAETDTVDVTAMGDSFGSDVGGIPKGSVVTASGVTDSAGPGIDETDVGSIATLLYLPDGANGRQAQAICTAVTLSSSVTDAVKWSASFKIAGAVSASN